MDDREVPERRISSRSTKGKLPKRFTASDVELDTKKKLQSDARAVHTSAAERRASKEVERLEAELEAQARLAKLRQEAISVQLELAKKSLIVEKAKVSFRRCQKSSGSSSDASGTEIADNDARTDQLPAKAVSATASPGPVLAAGTSSIDNDARTDQLPAKAVSAMASPGPVDAGPSSIQPQLSSAEEADDDETDEENTDGSASSCGSQGLPQWYRELLQSPSDQMVAAHAIHSRGQVHQNFMSLSGACTPVPTPATASAATASAVTASAATAVNPPISAPSTTSPLGVDRLAAQRTKATASAALDKSVMEPVLKGRSAQQPVHPGFVSRAFKPQQQQPQQRHDMSLAAPPIATLHGGRPPGSILTAAAPSFVPSHGVFTTAPAPSAPPPPPPAQHQSSYGVASQQYSGAPYRPSGHLKPLKLPQFDGNEKNYVSWRQKFMGLVGADPYVTEFYKMARLREALAGGSAEELITDVMDGPGAYQAAIQEIEAWYGGEDRQIERHEKEIINWPKIGTMKDTDKIKKFALKLRSVLVNMRSCGITPGRELYLAATEKVPPSLLLKYFEKHDDRRCDVQTFADWLLNVVHMLRKVDERQSSDKTQTASSTSSTGKQKPERSKHRTLTATGESKAKRDIVCQKCKQPHQLADCQAFTQMSTQERWRFVKPTNVCTCCLKAAKHRSADCNGKPCPRCGRKHHVLLHIEREPEQNKQPVAPAAPPSVTTTKEQNKQPVAHAASPSVTTTKERTAAGNTTSSSTIAFMTAMVTLEGTTRDRATALLDSGSSCSFITEELADRLDLSGKTEQVETVVLGGGVVQGPRKRVTINIRHEDGEGSTAVDAWVLPEITSKLDTIDWRADQHEWEHMNGIPFQPPVNDTVDLLIGLDAAHLHSALDERRGMEGGPIARRTPIGWVCFGPTPAGLKVSPRNKSLTAQYVTAERQLDKTVQKLWDLESVGMIPQPNAQYLTPDEKLAERMTAESLTHNGERYEVGIPWLHGKCEPDVQCDRHFAVQRLHSLQKSLAKRPDVRVQYAKVLSDYLRKGYTQLVTQSDATLPSGNGWFLPHFPVVRQDRVTTKVRVVFDAAARFQGTSINEEMYSGPKLQNDLVGILLKFCAYPVAISADISEMFLQVSLRPSDRRYHQFVWQESVDTEVQTYQFNRLVFGMRASPYLAGRALQETATQFGGSFSAEAAGAVKKSFYVDDLLHSTSSVAKATTLRSDLQELVGKGGFRLRKWISNRPEVLETIPEEDLSPAATVFISDHEDPVSTKTLGVTWRAEEDAFSFVYPQPDEPVYTRRGVLRQLARIFDPRGQLQPFTIRSRVLFQEACISGQAWDDPLSDTQQRRWQQWFAEIPALADVRVPRSFRQLTNDKPLSLHTFTDASEAAFAAVCYVHQEQSDGPALVTLAMARARPAPMKRKSIPMLELQGAVLGARLATHVSEVLDIPVQDRYFWTDSMNVMYWIRSPSRKFKMDVGNRVAEIQEKTQSVQWQHVPGKQNPADKATRGMSASELATDRVWWHGPQFIAEGRQQWPSRQITVPSELPGMLKRPAAASLIGQTKRGSCIDPNRYSTWNRLVRVTAWCLRVFRRQKPASTELSVDELTRAKEYWLASAQQDAYPEEYGAAQKGKSLTSGPLVKLQPVADQSGSVPLLRVGGRLREARHLPSSVRCPVILPRNHRVTELIIDHEDRECGHTVGSNHLLARLSTDYWIVKGRSAVKEHCSGCVLCKKHRAPPATPPMGLLPDSRTAGPLRAFERVGVDYAGPFLTRQGRGRAQVKRYVCVITCLLTRACHLELVYSLDADGMLMALTRFIKRRGQPSEIVSDNGTNFVATDRELREAVDNMDGERVTASMAARGIVWRFNPPNAPHFGGVFETMVKSMKRALQAVLYKADLTDEELHTALVQAESLINSRPLTAVSADAKDPQPLTPQQFLVGQMEVPMPAEVIDDDDDDDNPAIPRRRWQLIQVLVHQVWRRWLREFVPALNVRAKWFRSGRSIQIGDVMLVLDKHTPRARWPLGRVEAVHPGRDGVVRVVDIRYGGRTYRRPVHCLVPLAVSGAETEKLPEAADASPQVVAAE